MDMDFYGYLWICLSYDFVRVSYILCWLIAGLLNHQQYFRMSLRIDEDRSWHPKKWETKNLAESALVEIRMMASFSHPKMRSTWRIWAPGFLNPSKAPTREVITTIIGGTTKTSGWLADQEAAPLEPGYQVWWRLSLQLGGNPRQWGPNYLQIPPCTGKSGLVVTRMKRGSNFGLPVSIRSRNCPRNLVNG